MINIEGKELESVSLEFLTNRKEWFNYGGSQDMKNELNIAKKFLAAVFLKNVAMKSTKLIVHHLSIGFVWHHSITEVDSLITNFSTVTISSFWGGSP